MHRLIAHPNNVEGAEGHRAHGREHGVDQQDDPLHAWRSENFSPVEHDHTYLANDHRDPKKRQDGDEGHHELVGVGGRADALRVEERKEVEHEEVDDVDEVVERIRIVASTSERVGLTQARYDLPRDHLFEIGGSGAAS